MKLQVVEFCIFMLILLIYLISVCLFVLLKDNSLNDSLVGQDNCQIQSSKEKVYKNCKGFKVILQ